MTRVAVGGTFETIHRGHIRLLDKSFKLGDEVIIGVTSDKFAEKLGKKLDVTYTDRVYRLLTIINEISENSAFWITQLNDPYGPAIKEVVDFIVVSPETFASALKANSIRKKIGLDEMSIYVIPLVLSESGNKISSSWIKVGKMDEIGQKTALEVEPI
ncbi:MAG: pantetheine-phosphate adenylyltransferase [Conexivisphaerales archaeon]